MLKQFRPGARFWSWLSALPLTARLLLSFNVPLILALLALGAVIGTMMQQRMSDTADTALIADARVVEVILKNRETALAEQALTSAGLERVSSALAARDVARLRRLFEPVLIARWLDALYVFDANRHLLVQLGDPMAGEAQLASLPLFEGSLSGRVASSPLELDGALWLGAIAAHRNAEGVVDGYILAGKALDQTYLASLGTALGHDLAIVWGKTASYSFKPAPPALSVEHLINAHEQAAEYRRDGYAFHNMLIADHAYRVVAFDLHERQPGTILTYVFQPTDPLSETLRFAILQLLVVTIAVMAIGSVLAYLLGRSLLQPLTHLAHAARAIAGGDFDQPVPVESRDEIGRVATAFETMRLRVRAMLEAQQRWNTDLETTVRTRTAELKRLAETRDRLLQQTLTAQEEERRRVARELHDETSQALTAQLMELALVRDLPPDQIAPRLAALRASTAGVLKEINRIVHDLRPSLLDDYGLVMALNAYAEQRLKDDGVRVSAVALGDETRIPPMLETILYRVGQEAISNVARHAGASHLYITYLFQNHEGAPRVTLTIEDDGRGFDLEGADRPPGDRTPLGLVGMKERVAAVGGLLEISSAPGQGTTVIATVSIGDSEADQP